MFTKKEKNIIIVVALILILGALGFILRKAVKKQRVLRTADVVKKEALRRDDEYREEHDMPSEPVNMNTAGLAEIEALPFIGMERAKDILAYRDKNGPFKSLEELTQINGIGPKTLEKLKPLITL